MMNAKNRFRENAEKNFLKGYNCAQSVVLAFKDLLNLDETTLLKLSSSFGGGMGRLREVCGAVSGMFIVVGLLYGYSDVNDISLKTNHYSLVQELANFFESENGSIICRELLNLKEKKSSPICAPRTADYYLKRPCKKFIGDAAEILSNYISAHPFQKEIKQ